MFTRSRADKGLGDVPRRIFRERSDDSKHRSTTERHDSKRRRSEHTPKRDRGRSDDSSNRQRRRSNSSSRINDRERRSDRSKREHKRNYSYSESKKQKTDDIDGEKISEEPSKSEILDTEKVDNIEEIEVVPVGESHSLLALQSAYVEHKYPCKKKYAIMMGFCGAKYKGMALNPGIRSIEGDLIKAMERAKLLKPENVAEPKKLSFQRASRTDKGVSAARQVCSVNMHTTDINGDLDKLNEELPDDIIVYDFIRAAKSFDCHKFASSRIYEYLCPTFAFAPTLGDTWSGYKIPTEHLESVKKTLQNYKGTKNFFNYTSGKAASDPSCFRHIKEISCSDPYEVDELEWVRISIHGDSFIYHQIRKIVGMTITVMRKVAPIDHMTKSFEKQRCDVPLAPSLGLVLDEVKMTRYNLRFGSSHQQLSWEPYSAAVENFKKNNIETHIYTQEKSTSSMFNWLKTLQNHTFFTENVLPEILLGKSEASETPDTKTSEDIEVNSGAPVKVEDNSDMDIDTDEDEKL